MPDLISVTDAERLIAQSMPSFGTERVALDAAAGRILRQTVHAERDQPPFDRVMMDGIAIALNDGARRSFRHAGVQLAGMSRQSLDDPQSCIEVTTGAMLPRGCDTVIPIEQVQQHDSHYQLADRYTPAQGQFIHPYAADCRQGDVLLEPGVRLGGPEIAVLAANGVHEVEVAISPSITIIATGDELADVEQELAEGQIRGSNDRALAAALHARGFEHVQLTRVGDDLAATTATLADLLRTRQVLVLSGGVSVGQRDFVPAALKALGVTQVLHRIAQRPGKPMWFGVGPQRQVVFGLPGNPVSALVCGVRYLLPALQQAVGQAPDPPMRIRLDQAVDTNAALTCFVPVRVHHDQHACAIGQPLPTGTSGDFSSLPRTHGFVQCPSGQSHVAAGAVAAFYRW